MIEFYSIDKEVPDIDPELFVSALSSLIRSEGFDVGDIAIIVCSDEYLLELNKKHLDHDYYTDIITFDYSDHKTISGDLFISVDRVFDNANRFSPSPIEEFKRVCSHGVLHLCGYKDKTTEEQELMRLMEEKALAMFSST